MKHPTDDELAAFSLGNLQGPSADTMVSHLKKCSDCRSVVASHSTDNLFGRIQAAQPLARPATGEIPSDRYGTPKSISPLQYGLAMILAFGGVGLIVLVIAVLRADAPKGTILVKGTPERAGVRADGIPPQKTPLGGQSVSAKSAKDNPPSADPRPILPRRALIISPENYLLLNRTQFFQQDVGRGEFENTLIRGFSAGAPLNISPDQVFVLSDSDLLRTAIPPQKGVVEKAIRDFCESSRAADRILFLWSGHACDIAGKTYLIPLEGDKDAQETCIPLDWVYEQLAQCKARQKVLIFDAFRYPPARGLELPATGAMTEAVARQLDAPPAGVQVWSACSGGQQSIEFESGSVFQLAMKEALSEMSAGALVKGSDPLLLEPLVIRVNQIMKVRLAREASESDFTQTSRLSGKEAARFVAPSAEARPPAVVFSDPDKSETQNADIGEILHEIKEFRPTKQSQEAQLQTLRVASLPSLPVETMALYRDEGFNPFALSEKELKAELVRNKEKYPLRVATFEAGSKLRESMDLRLKEYLPSAAGSESDLNRKKQFLSEAKDPTAAIAELEKMLEHMKIAGKEREKETNKRWLAHFDMAEARLMSRLVYLHEYKNLIAQIRTDTLPGLHDKVHVGWHVNTSPQVQAKDAKVNALAKEASKAWNRIEREHPKTPWAVIARREKSVSRGMTWAPTRR
jgi:hypothetical protein